MEKASLFYYILIFGVLMSLVSLIGALTISATKKTLNKFLTFFIAMAYGTLLGGAFFHMLPHALNKSSQHIRVMLFLVGGSLASL